MGIGEQQIIRAFLDFEIQEHNKEIEEMNKR